jgi:hypothetical protein
LNVRRNDESEDAFIEYLKATETVTRGGYSRPCKRRLPFEANVRTGELRGYFDTVWNRFACGGACVGIPKIFYVRSFGFSQIVCQAHAGTASLDPDWYMAASFRGSGIFVRDEPGCSNLRIYDLEEATWRASGISSLSSMYLGLASAIRSGCFTCQSADEKAAQIYRQFAGPEAAVVCTEKSA